MRDLTAPMPGTSFVKTTGARPYQPLPWDGVAGSFKHMMDRAGLNDDVALSTRNAASLRGHFLNTNPADCNTRGNLALQTWDKVVLQEQSAEPLTRRTNGNGELLNRTRSPSASMPTECGSSSSRRLRSDGHPTATPFRGLHRPNDRRPASRPISRG